MNRLSEPDLLQKKAQNTGLYLHVPFCLQKCPYCSFYSLGGRLDLRKRYVTAIKQQIRRFAARRQIQPHPLTTIFFGGGTPSTLSPDVLHELLNDCLHHFPCVNKPEVSLEVNPATVDARGLQDLRRSGFNRLSIGVQSFSDLELQQIGRPYFTDDAVQAVLLARQAGFTNISMDLMYGLPGQNAATWQDNLQQALELGPEHLSLYELTIEEGTPFARRHAEGHLHLPDEEAILSMMEKTRQLLTAAGLIRYEISNFSRPGYQCRHNINYWQNGSYIGLGPGAVSCLDGTRFTVIEDVDQFCALLDGNQEVCRQEDTLDAEARFRETVIMGLRMINGVSIQALDERFNMDPADYYGETLHRLVEQNLLKIHQGRLRLTDQGLLLANTVMAHLV